jgi:GTPase KRas
MKYKVVIIGLDHVGKTSLALQFAQNCFFEETDPTIEGSYIKEVKIDNKNIILEIVDIAGQDDFEMLLKQWVKLSHGFVIMYDITSRPSFEKIPSYVFKFKQETKENEQVPMVLVANKCDLESARKITTSEALALAELYHCPLIEVSCKLNINVEDTFLKLILEIFKTNEQGKNNSTQRHNNNNNDDGDDHKSCSLQ